jgi:hypothetical protein
MKIIFKKNGKMIDSVESWNTYGAPKLGKQWQKEGIVLIKWLVMQ